MYFYLLNSFMYLYVFGTQLQCTDKCQLFYSVHNKVIIIIIIIIIRGSKTLGVFLTVSPTDFLVRDWADFTVQPENAKSGKMFVILATPQMLSRRLR